MPQQSLQNSYWVTSARGGKPAKLDQVNSPFPALNLCYPTVRNIEARGQRALRQARILPEFPEFFAKCPVFCGMNRFFHCFHYGNLVECFQNRYSQMLTLHPDWRIITSGAVAADLLAQIQCETARREAARHLVAGSLDLLVATWPPSARSCLVVESISNAMWRISNHYYTFLPEDDDAALAACIERAWSNPVTVVVVGAHESLKRELLTSVLGGRSPSVWALDSYLSRGERCRQRSTRAGPVGERCWNCFAGTICGSVVLDARHQSESGLPEQF
jgi:hypothetical protein